MKKFFLVLPLFILVFQSDLFSQTVYITKTGEKYHTSECRYLKNSASPIDLSEAVNRNYTSCKVCVPADNILPVIGKEDPPPDPSARIIRCMAITKKNTQCKRNTSNSSGYCWQHERR
ncbi:MAG: hypothetical protein IPM38_05000 [Ignavibacteria bacterium]|nr:hypothetical protein [Ignavibacteria bacterium]